MRADAIRARYALCHFHSLAAEERTEAGAVGSRTRRPRRWNRGPARSQGVREDEMDPWPRKGEKKSSGGIFSRRQCAILCSKPINQKESFQVVAFLNDEGSLECGSERVSGALHQHITQRQQTKAPNAIYMSNY